MDPKQIDLIKSGVKLFADKGYYQTSIQDIATEAGISKGAFYLYFESKSTFISEIFRYFHTQIIKRIEKVTARSLPPKESLAEQISAFIHYIADYKEFIVMQLQENSMYGNNLNNLIEQIKNDNFYWMYNGIKSIYKQQIDDYIMDIILQLDGLITGYLKWFVVDEITIDTSRVGTYIVRRIDDLVQGVLRDNESPLVKANLQLNLLEQPLFKQLLTLREAITKLSITKSEKENLLEVVEMIFKKIRSGETVNPIIFQGLLIHLQGYESLNMQCKQLADILNVDLLALAP